MKIEGLPSGNQTWAMENVPFIGDFPMKTSIYRGFPIAMFDYQRVYFHWLIDGWEGPQQRET